MDPLERRVVLEREPERGQRTVTWKGNHNHLRTTRIVTTSPGTGRRPGRSNRLHGGNRLADCARRPGRAGSRSISGRASARSSARRGRRSTSVTRRERQQPLHQTRSAFARSTTSTRSTGMVTAFTPATSSRPSATSPGRVTRRCCSTATASDPSLEQPTFPPEVVETQWNCGTGTACATNWAHQRRSRPSPQRRDPWGG